jgi:hypothetical protein
VTTTGPGQSALLLLDAVSVLTSDGIDYAVIGALAASVHGVVRASIDADAVLSINMPRLRQLEVVACDRARGPDRDENICWST